MLIGFEYYDPKENIKKIVDYRFAPEEIQIARRFVDAHPFDREKRPCCPGCGSERNRLLRECWDVSFLICEECWTIYIPLDRETSRRFEFESEITTFRRSDRFQNASTEQREILWNNLLDWIRYRAFKYLGRNRDLTIVDIGNRFRTLSSTIAESEMAGRYQRSLSILEDGKEPREPPEDAAADLVLMIDTMQRQVDPGRYLQKALRTLKEGGLLFLSLKLGTGFDVLTLQGNVDGIFPYEHVFLPSRNIIKDLFERNGFEILEMVTPGVMDIPHVQQHPERLHPDNLFIRYMIETGNDKVFEDFQKFLQRNGYSSYVQLVSRKKRTSPT